MHSSLLLCAAGVVLSLCILQVQSASSRYGDAIVNLYKNGAATIQDNIYVGDEFIVNFRLRVPSVTEYNDVNRLNVTQYVVGQNPSQSITAILSRVENNLFSVTEVSPEGDSFFVSKTVLSRSTNNPYTYYTQLSLSNSQDETLTNKNVFNIVMSSYRIASNPGFRAELFVQP